MAKPTVNLILAEFGEDRINQGGVSFSSGRLEPTLSTFRKHFPGLKVTLYTDIDIGVKGVEVRKVKPPFRKRGPRAHYGNRANDYYKIVGLLESKADIAIAADSDMYICSSKVRTIVPIARKFGFCVPCNPRWLVRNDAISGRDGSRFFDESKGLGFAMNFSPVAFHTKDRAARKYLQAYVEEMRRRPARGPLVLWRTAWKTGYTPYLLPPQWCVCQASVGIGDEIILHVGHKKVARYYKIEI